MDKWLAIFAAKRIRRMLDSSLAYAGWGSIVGAAILLLGTPLLFLKRTA